MLQIVADPIIMTQLTVVRMQQIVALAIANAIRHNNQKPLPKFVHYVCKKLLTFLCKYVII